MTNRKPLVKIKPLLWCILFALLIFKPVIALKVSQFDNFDELIVVIFVALFFVNVIRRRLERIDLIILFLCILLLIIGLISNFKCGIQTGAMPIILDFYNMFKFALVYIASINLFKREKDKAEILKYLAVVIKAVVLISTLCMLLNLVTDIGMYTDHRYGLRAYNFVYPRVGGFYSACNIWIVILAAEDFINPKKLNKIFIALVLVNMMATLRTRAFGYVLIFAFLYYIYVIRGYKHLSKLFFLPAVALLFILGKDQFRYYFSGDRARNVLVRYGIVTANENFPWGSGFGTYGTGIARKYYSKLYLMYGFNSIWGLSETNSSFLTDTFWPAIVAEFGYIGLLIYLFLIIALFIKALGLAENSFARLIVVYMLTVILISSVVSSGFLAASVMMIFMAFLQCTMNEIKKEA